MGAAGGWRLARLRQLCRAAALDSCWHEGTSVRVSVVIQPEGLAEQQVFETDQSTRSLVLQQSKYYRHVSAAAWHFMHVRPASTVWRWPGRASIFVILAVLPGLLRRTGVLEQNKAQVSFCRSSL